MLDYRKKVVLFVLFMFLLVATLTYLSARIREGLPPDDTGAAGNAKLLLTRTAPAIDTNLIVGSNFTVAVIPDLTTGANVAELVVQFDPAAVRLDQIVKETGYLYLNENINNTTGIATIDVAKGSAGDFVANASLARFTFAVKTLTGGSTTIRLVNGTTLGFPDLLSTTSGLGQLVINYTFSAGGKYTLTKLSPAATSLNPGATLVVSLGAENTASAGVGEIVLNYDITRLAATAIAEEAGILALNKDLGLTTGKAMVDIAKSGPGDLTANTSLVRFTFTVKSAALNGNANISIDATSTLGVPNILAASGQGVLAINILRTRCGDSAIQTPNSDGITEVCDDGNTVNNDQCSSTCQNKCTAPQIWNGTACVTPTRCGDGVKQTPNTAGVNEVCDDGNTVNNDQCSSTCLNQCTAPQIWNGAACVNPAVCGDGIVQTPNSTGLTEVCDDGNLVNGDQCSSTCQNKCTAPQVWNGTTCRAPLPVGCKGDYNKDTLVNIADFLIFGQNYLLQSIDCTKDIAGGNCALDLADFIEFGQVYKIANACVF